MLTEVTDHKIYGSAITKVVGLIKSSNGKLHQWTTHGWKILLEWKDVLFYWVPLKELKQSNPVELAEYDVINEISDEPSFIWWVKETFRRWDRIISRVKSNYWRTSHKIGIRVPKTVKETYDIERQYGTNLWTKDIEK